MTPIQSTEHSTFRKCVSTPRSLAEPIAILTDDIVVGVPMIELWKEMSYADLLYTIRLANPDTHIRKIEICNGGLSVRIFV